MNDVTPDEQVERAARAAFESFGWSWEHADESDREGWRRATQAEIDAAGVPALVAEVERLIEQRDAYSAGLHEASARALSEMRVSKIVGQHSRRFKAQRNTARQELAGLRERVGAVAKDWEQHAPDKIVGAAVAHDLRAALAEPGGQVGEGCGHDLNALVDVDAEGHAVCSECVPSLSDRPAPVVPDSARCTCANDGNAIRCTYHTQADYDAADRAIGPVVPDSAGRERVEQIIYDAVYGNSDIPSAAEAVLAVVGQGVTEERVTNPLITLAEDIEFVQGFYERWKPPARVNAQYRAEKERVAAIHALWDGAHGGMNFYPSSAVALRRLADHYRPAPATTIEGA